jgi:hypothetical protein
MAVGAAPPAQSNDYLPRSTAPIRTIFFNNGCGTANSYYFGAHGDAPFLRPSTALEAWWRARHLEIDHYARPDEWSHPR